MPDHRGNGAEHEPIDSALTSTTTAMHYRRRVGRVLGGIVLAFAAYWASSYVVAYSDDAYVTSDLVAVAPQVTGRVVAVHIVDNQPVATGTKLAPIDPLPFELIFKEKQA